MNRFTEFFTGVIIVLTFIGYLLLSGCAKTATESAADAALQQINAVEKQIKKECPTAEIDEDMSALRTTVKSQLATCELQRAKIESDKVKWQVACVSLLIVVGIWSSRKLI